jgi:hypothetical protein
LVIVGLGFLGWSYVGYGSETTFSIYVQLYTWFIKKITFCYIKCYISLVRYRLDIV